MKFKKMLEKLEKDIEKLEKDFDGNTSCLQVNELKDDMVKHSAIYGNYLRLEYQSITYFAMIDYIDELYTNSMYLSVEKKLQASEVRVTEKRITAEITSSKTFNRLEQCRVRLKAIYGQVVSLRKALEHKKDMLVQLSSMRKEEMKSDNLV